MKNPFAKNDHKLLIAGIALSTIAAGAAAYLLLTEKGSQLRERVSQKFRAFFDKDHVPAAHHDPQAYLHHKNKSPKSDRNKLLKHEILHEGHQPSQS